MKDFSAMLITIDNIHKSGAALAESLAALTQREFRCEAAGPSPRYDGVNIFIADNGASISVRCDELLMTIPCIAQFAPETKEFATPMETREKQSINIGSLKTVEQIAKDIERRLLPVLDREVAARALRKAQWEETRASALLKAERIKLMSRDAFEIRQPDAKDKEARLDFVSARKPTQIKGEIIIKPTGLAIHLRWLDDEEVCCMVEALAELHQRRKLLTPHTV